MVALVRCGMSFERAERMTAHDRMVYLIAFGMTRGGQFDFDNMRFEKPNASAAALGGALDDARV